MFHFVPLAFVLAFGCQVASALASSTDPQTLHWPQPQNLNWSLGIIGGSSVPDGKYPFMAAILRISKSTKKKKANCGGTILNGTPFNYYYPN